MLGRSYLLPLPTRASAPTMETLQCIPASRVWESTGAGRKSQSWVTLNSRESSRPIFKMEERNRVKSFGFVTPTYAWVEKTFHSLEDRPGTRFHRSFLLLIPTPCNGML